jgi:NAD(P)-dependent dehydrogenase (short-subunit alcohol dehydrogenase family)
MTTSPHAPRPDRPVAVLTGGSRGIGAAVLDRLLDFGYDCAVIGRTRPAARQVAFIARDLSEQREVVAACADLRAFLGDRPASVLVNNAGGAEPVATHMLDPDRVAADLTLNLTAPMLLCGCVLPAMRAAGGGSIVNIGSTAGRTGVPYLPTYSAAKSGLIAFTQSLAAETAGDGVRVNAVCPGAVATDLAAAGRAGLSAFHGLPPEAYEERMAHATGLGRLLRPEEVAEVVCWLAQGAAEAVTGQTINVCGTIEMG